MRLDGHLNEVVGMYALNLQESFAADGKSLSISSLSQLENMLRNGTLFCAIANDIFKINIKPWSKRPKSYNQCLSNVQKAIEGIRRITQLPQGTIYGGIEDDIVRGEWSVIVSLLYQLSLLVEADFSIARKKEKNEKSRVSFEWGNGGSKNIVPHRSFCEQNSSSFDLAKPPGSSDTLAEEELMLDAFNTPHLPDPTADIYLAALPTEHNNSNSQRKECSNEVFISENAESQPSDLDALLGLSSVKDWDENAMPLPPDSEVSAILAEGISSKLVRELEEARQNQVYGQKVSPSQKQSSSEERKKLSPDILPGMYFKDVTG